jgi:hypothetical protein
MDSNSSSSNLVPRLTRRQQLPVLVLLAAVTAPATV